VSRGYHRAVKVLSVAMMAIGVAILAVTAVNGSGSVGYLMGIAFIGVGIGRLWVARRMER